MADTGHVRADPDDFLLKIDQRLCDFVGDTDRAGQRGEWQPHTERMFFVSRMNRGDDELAESVELDLAEGAGFDDDPIRHSAQAVS